MIITETQLKKLIEESIKRVMNEVDLFPDGIDCTPTRTAWEGISNALINIQQYMEEKNELFKRKYDFKNGIFQDIGENDVIELVDYIHLTLNNVLKNTMPNLMK